jgi:hypothetical protein
LRSINHANDCPKIPPKIPPWNLQQLAQDALMHFIERRGRISDCIKEIELCIQGFNIDKSAQPCPGQDGPMAEHRQKAIKFKSP